MHFQNGLFLFTNDLRVQDNIALAEIAAKTTFLDCLFIIDSAQDKPDRYQCLPKGANAKAFMMQSLFALNTELEKYGQHLKIMAGDPATIVKNYVAENNIQIVVQSENPGVYEKSQSIEIKSKLDALKVAYDVIWQHTIINTPELVKAGVDFNLSFSNFRKRITPLLKPKQFVQQIASLPPSVSIRTRLLAEDQLQQTSLLFDGGCHAGNKHINDYFSTSFPSFYKETRNRLDDWYSSTKFSPWLANGSLSVRQVIKSLAEYEKATEKNESTQWILFELLWRDYFHHYCQHHQQKLFSFKGISDTKPLTSFHSERFAKWCSGNTPYPLVNAIMSQLNETGFISNRARQIAASCWVNELSGDWRYGAAYFQQQLIDHDVAINWGNWQYIAGVGSDPRGGRWFNLEKQQNQYDPDHQYLNRWTNNNELTTTLDSNDIADWPIADTAQME